MAVRIRGGGRKEPPEEERRKEEAGRAYYIPGDRPLLPGHGSSSASLNLEEEHYCSS